MSIFKCKMCGGTIEFEQGATVGVCDSCGTKQTLPRLDDDKKANLYDRANHFRRNNDFDKAMGIYEQILNEDNTDAEAYWSLVLCRYGIEYVEDPSSHKRIPTVNRAQFTSIYMDEDYKSALQYADGYQKQIYEEEAKAIDDIQKGILEISNKEEPFDVFICYKETDANGRRTQDSVLANDLYHQLTQEGFKVFFSRITLEDKLGVAYEPYIFAALNSSKVMVAIGTKPEYFNAVWVKNEWSRYLALIKNGAKKMLIPAYRDMDPYDLPEEFSHLQAQDMSKLGFMQDLIRGIKKIISADAPKATVKETTVVGGANADSLLKRAFIFIEDKDWESADNYLEKALDVDPENANGYLGKLLVELRITKKEQLVNCDSAFDSSNNYQKAIRYADATLKDELTGYIDTICQKNEQKRLEQAYSEALTEMNSAKDEYSYKDAAELFKKISDYSDASTKYDYCLQQAEICRQEDIYSYACSLTTREAFDISGEIENFEKALDKFSSISDYKDSSDKQTWCKLKIDELQKKLEIKRKRNKRLTIIVSSSAAVVTAFLIVLFNVIIPAVKYSSASKKYDSGNYQDAFSIYTELGDYKDSSKKATVSQYLLAGAQFDSKEYKKSYENYKAIKDYEDSATKLKTSGLAYATELIAKSDYSTAETVLKEIGDYENSKALLNQCRTELAKISHEKGEYYNSIQYYQSVDGYDKNADFYIDSCYNYGKELLAKNDYSGALLWFGRSGNYSDTAEQIKATKYAYINANKNNTDTTTYQYLKELKAANYKDSANIFKNLYAWKATITGINTSESDESTKMTSISKYSNIYFHFKLSGGEPNASTVIKYTGTFPNRSNNSGKMEEEWSDGWSGYCLFYYNNPAFGSEGDFTLKIYDGSGNVIGESTVRLTS